MHLCDDPTSASQALAVLSSKSTLFIDCEGLELGAQSGDISLLCVGTPSSTQVYLFDCITLPRSSLEPLFALLTSLRVTKFVWDGRHDYSEVYHRFNVECRNVVDLQLVDILSRKMRREDEYNRIRRLSLRCHPFHHVKQLDTDGVHALLGLKRAPREHNIYFADLGDEGTHH
jgi:exonuclease 3'-5' domain-containing protein 1